MISIKKSDSIPAILLDKGKKEVTTLKRLYTRYSTAYRNGDKKFKFTSNIYGDKDVKKQLVNDQNRKCCFCEAKVTTSYGDVEHFRPKGGYEQDENDSLNRPGYYWLAYDWNNLFFVCEICNRSYKKNYFPISDNNTRASNHKENIVDEVPLLINPALENPENHLMYIGCIPKSVNGNEKGIHTIKKTGLDDDTRIGLNEDRFEYLKPLKLLFECAQRLTPGDSLRVKIEGYLLEKTKSTSEYSLMVKCALRDEFRFI